MKKLLWMAVLALGAIDVASAAPFTFGRPERLVVAWNTAASVAIGDANGDGRDDLAATEDTPRRLSLYLQQSDGSLAPRVTLPVTDSYRVNPVVFADLDADGKDEMLVGHTLIGGGQLTVARLDGTTLTSTPYALPMGCQYIATGDIDGDGKLDVACHDMQVTVTLFYGDGLGGFRQQVEMNTPAGVWDEDLKRIRLADVTGDGRVDMLVTASTVSSFFVFANNGLGGFWPGPTAYGHGWSPTGTFPAALEVLDVDGDGIVEVVTASPDNQPDSTLRVYRRNANGYLALAQVTPMYDSPTALAAGDVDGDGDRELVAGHWGFFSATLLGADGGGFDSQSRYDLPGFGLPMAGYHRIGDSHSLALGDIDGDGCGDLASATYGGISVLYGCRPYFDRIPASDFDGDGNSDLVWKTDTTFAVIWRWGDAKSACVWPCHDLLQVPFIGQAVGDFDGDGGSDMFFRNRDTGENQVVLLASYPRAITTVTNPAWQVVGAGDFDGDDRSDVLWRNLATGMNAIWRSADNTTQLPITGVTNRAWKIVGTGDFDGDHKSDVVWRNFANGINAIWRSGDHASQLPLTGVSNLAWKIAGIGDFDGDGRDDLVWRNDKTGVNAIWRSGNSATQMSVTAVVNLDWKIVAVADYNGDDRSDLLWRNTRSGANVIWLGANATQQRAVDPLPPLFYLLPMAVAQ